jgi:solute:Na+ symporter, SSS family
VGYLASFAIALIGAAFYFAEESGYVAILQPLTGLEHKYSKLLLITASVLVIGALAFVAGAVQRAGRRTMTP